MNEEMVYTGILKKHQLKTIFKVMLFYLIELIFWLIVAKLYRGFGSQWIIPSVSAMWIVGAGTVYFIKEERDATIKQTKWTIFGYLAFLFMYRIVIQIVSPISSEQMGAALNISVPAASGMAVAGTLQNILLIASVMVPLGFLIWCAQKFRTYQGGMTKSDAFRKFKDIRIK